MTPVTLLLVGAVLLAMGLCERPVQRLPLSPSLVYLCVGWAAASLGAPLGDFDLRAEAHWLLPASETAVLLSLFAIGLRLGAPAPAGAWRLAALLASVGLLLTIVLVASAAWALLALPWAAALLLAAMLAPTDPVLASDVQVRSEQDRDAVRLTLTIEGALNDGTAFPAVMLALAALGLHELGTWGSRWALRDLLWPVAGGLALGWLAARVFRSALLALLQRRHPLARDELFYLGAVTLVYGLAALLQLSTFLAVFACGCGLFAGARGDAAQAEVCGRMIAFGGRIERLVEVMMVLLIGAALARVTLSGPLLAFAAATVCVARPLAVLPLLRGSPLPPQQGRRVAWFGIRGVGSLFYLCYALEHGLDAPWADALIDGCLVVLAASIVLHGISATPLLEWQRGRRPPPRR